MKNSATKRLTIYDLAEKAGVSIATVSRVMNNAPNVNEQTRIKILKLLDKTPYNPKAVKSHLPCIGVMMETGKPGGNLFNNYNSAILNGVSDYVFKHALALSIFPFNQRAVKHPNDIIRRLQERCINGVVAIFHEGHGECVRALKENIFPHFAIGCEPDVTPHSAYCDESAAVELALDHLLSLGHRRIGFINADSGDEVHKRRLSALRGLAAAKGCVDTERLVFTNPQYLPFHKRLGYETVMAFKTRFLDNPPDALLCMDDDIGAGALKAFGELGVAVPKRISVLGFDDYEFSAYTHPPLSSVRHPLYEMGGYAAECIHRWLNDAPSEQRKLFNPKLILRESCAKPEALK